MTSYNRARFISALVSRLGINVIYSVPVHAGWLDWLYVGHWRSHHDGGATRPKWSHVRGQGNLLDYMHVLRPLSLLISSSHLSVEI